MLRRPIRLLVLLACPLFIVHIARAIDWQKPTPEELAMTAEPSEPNAEAVYLYREEATDDKQHTMSMYVRIKILRDEGKHYGDVEIASGGALKGVTDIQGRTIHSDGTVIPFTGKPYEKTLIKSATFRYRAKVFSLPEVETGSILEYRYKLYYDDYEVISPTWEIQQELYVRRAHYHFVPTNRMVQSTVDNGNTSSSLAYSQRLPAGAKVVQTRDGYELDVSKVPSLPRENYEPPMEAFAYRVRFYYTGVSSTQQFWESYGKQWSKRMDHFMAPSPATTQAAHELTSAAGTEDQKLGKLYDAVMKLDNTDLTREHSQEENQAEGVKQIKTAADIWALRRGSSDEIALLFLALARAAGYHAYAMAVVDRSRDFFQPEYLSGVQMDALVAIVVVDGKEKFFDPGERYMSYGQLYWTHAMASGIRQQEGGTALGTTPGNTYKETVVQRLANLTLAGDGTITGSASLVLTGELAERWRRRALEGDVDATKKEFDEELQEDLAPGAILHIHHFLGLDTESTNLVARVDVSGSLGTGTGKRIFLPLVLFAAGAHDPFTSSHREEPVDLRFPYHYEDQVVLHLPEGMQVESVPGTTTVTFPQHAVYQSTTKVEGQTITYARSMIVASVLYSAQEYAKLKSFFDDVSSKDQAQAVLRPVAPAAGQ